MKENYGVIVHGVFKFSIFLFKFLMGFMPEEKVWFLWCGCMSFMVLLFVGLNCIAVFYVYCW